MGYANPFHAYGFGEFARAAARAARSALNRAISALAMSIARRVVVCGVARIRQTVCPRG